MHDLYAVKEALLSDALKRWGLMGFLGECSQKYGSYRGIGTLSDRVLMDSMIENLALPRL